MIVLRVVVVELSIGADSSDSFELSTLECYRKGICIDLDCALAVAVAVVARLAQGRRGWHIVPMVAAVLNTRN